MQSLEPDLSAFIRRSIHSLWALEVLLLLHRNMPASWREESIDRELRASPLLVTSCLRQLREAGLVRQDAAGAWLFSPATSELGAFANRLASAFSERPVAVINTIILAGDERLHNFAEAFRFTEKKDE